MAHLSNRTLVRELKNGERSACSHLVDAYQARLLGEAVNVFRLPSEDAEELVSDVLLAVVKNIHTFEFKRKEDEFHVWVVSIFRNKVRDHLRHRLLTHGLTAFYDESTLEKGGEMQEHEVVKAILHQYYEAVRQSEEENDPVVATKLLTIADALEQLESWERVLLRCRALEIPYEEIAGYTGKPASQLKVYHARVKKKLVKILAEYYPELRASGNE